MGAGCCKSHDSFHTIAMVHYLLGRVESEFAIIDGIIKEICTLLEAQRKKKCEALAPNSTTLRKLV